MFPPYDPEWVLGVTAELCYSQHGGSGYSFTRACVMNMDLGEIDFHLRWLDERREAEAKAIRKAGK